VSLTKGTLYSKMKSQFKFEEVNTLDVEKAKSYYNQIRSEDLCDCDYCRNNIHEVKAAYSTFFIGTHLITVSSIT
jgi:hypothetical protein